MSSSRKWGDSGASKSSVNWGDVDGDDEGPLSPSASSSSAAAAPAINPVVPVVSSTKVDAKGIKTVVEYGTNAQGEKIRITRKIKVNNANANTAQQAALAAAATLFRPLSFAVDLSLLSPFTVCLRAS